MARIEESIKVSRNYQITIPSKIRQKFKISEGELVSVVYDDRENVVKIEPQREVWSGGPLRDKESIKVSRNYQITIPSKIRQKFKISEGELVSVVYDDRENVVKIEPLRI